MTAEQPTLRRATPADVDAIVRLTEAAYSKYIVQLGRKPQPMTTNYHQLITTHPIWLLEVQQDLAGVLVTEHEQDTLLIYSVAVSPSYQKRGFGRQLLAWAEQEAQRAGYRHIRLYTNALMTENIALYSRLGYQESHREPLLGGIRVHMKKELASEGHISEGGTILSGTTDQLTNDNLDLA